MRPTELLQEIRKMRFEESFYLWPEGRITQEEAARMVGVCSRTFRRYVDRYHKRYGGWTAKHFYAWYRREGGTRSYSWVKTKLQEKDCIAKTPKREAHRKRRERALMPEMLIHQDGSTHEWVPGQKWDRYHGRCHQRALQPVLR